LDAVPAQIFTSLDMISPDFGGANVINAVLKTR